MTVVV